ncbi:MAG: nucleotide exchange factor GrpE [Robiginitomaculum sp.]|nr:MAG: nucleotide exchange factor GrpE [Robiginitomaculum sp.]
MTDQQPPEENAPANQNDEAEEAPNAEQEQDSIVRLEADLAESRDRILRLAAELENVRKRSERAEQDARKYGVSRFAEDMLSVADNLYRALETVPAEARLDASDRMTQLVEGVDMTQKSLQTALERHGIKRINPKGEKFDHNLHQAIAQIPSTEHPNGTVAEVVQHGYTIGDRVLRAAMVAVSTGSPSQTGAESTPPDPEAKPGSTIDTKA